MCEVFSLSGFCAVFRLFFLCLVFGVQDSVANKSHTDQEHLNGYMTFASSEIHNIDLSPDGKFVVYVKRPSDYKTGDVVTIHVQSTDDLSASIQLPGRVIAQKGGNDLVSGQRIRPKWSPDGKKVAYLAQDQEKFYLNIWYRESHEHQVFSGQPALKYYGAIYDLQWSPDSNMVYYLGDNSLVGSAVKSDEEKTTGGLKENDIKRDPTISVIEAGEDLSQVYEKSMELADVMVASLATNSSKVLMSGAAARVLLLSPKGRQLLVATELPDDMAARQAYMDFYVLSLPANLNKVSLEEAGTGALRENAVLDWRTKPVKPIVSKVKQWLARPSWSPDSKYLAYAEHGALASGDVFLLNVKTGNLRNLTQDFDPEAKNLLGRDYPAIPDRTFDFQGKFGNARSAVIWSRDGSTLYTTLKNRKNIYNDQLSAIFVDSGEIVSFDLGAGAFISNIMNENGVASRGSQPGSLVAQGSIQSENGGINYGFLELVPDNSKMRATVLTDFSKGKHMYHTTFSRGVRGGKVVFMYEHLHQPMELFALDVGEKRIAQITEINKKFVEKVALKGMDILWNTPDGSKVKGYLITRQSDVDKKKLPFVVSVYPGGGFASRVRHIYRGAPDYLNRPLPDLIEQGYAVFLPDLRVVGGGNTCSDLGEQINVALDAVVATGKVDGERAAIIGHSFGGWATNCIITRTNRFRAAVSSAGTADLISINFGLLMRGIGGGQARIGSTVWESPDLYWQESPVSGVHQISTPLLIAHGTDDEHVPYEQSTEMFGAMSIAGKTAKLVTYEGVAHDVNEHPDFSERVVRWLEKYIELDPEVLVSVP